MKSLNYTIFYFIIAALAAPSMKGMAQPLDDLQGVWTMPCDRGLRKTQIIQQATVQNTEYFNQDKDCTKESFRFTTTGRIQLSSAQLSWMDFNYDQIELTVFIPAVIDDFNIRKVCGFNDWLTAQPRTITGLKCALFNMNKETQIPKINDVKYGIYKLENDRLYYGQLTLETDGSTSDRRPTIFTDTYFTLDTSTHVELNRH